MELYEGECCWPSTRGVVKKDEGDDAEGDREWRNKGVEGSANICQNMSARDWQWLTSPIGVALLSITCLLNTLLDLDDLFCGFMKLTMSNPMFFDQPGPPDKVKHEPYTSGIKSIRRRSLVVALGMRVLVTVCKMCCRVEEFSGNVQNMAEIIHDVISKVVCAICKKCLISVNHDKCLRNYVNGKNSRGKKQKTNVSFKENQMKYQPKVTKLKKVESHKSLATPKPRKYRLLLRWSPTGTLFDQEGKIADSNESISHYDCVNGDNACTSNSLEPKIKRFPNSTSLLNRLFKFVYAAILDFGDLQWGNILITRVYFVEGLGHNLFSVGQFCDSDLEVAFRRNACFVRNLEGVDLLKGVRSTNLYTINLHEMASASPICLMARASSTKSWLWHQHLSHLNFDTINDLARNDIVLGLPNINGKRYVLVIVDDYSRYTWVHFLRSKDKAPEVIITFLKRITVLLQIYNRRTKKIMETMNVSFDELLAMAFEQRSSKPGLQSMTYGQISPGLDLTYAPLTITTQQPSEDELDLLFEAMYDDYIGGQPSATGRTAPPAQEPQVRQTSMASTSIADTAPTPTNPSSLATNIPISSQDVDELNPNAMVNGNTFVNPFAISSTSVAASSSSQNVDPSNIHTFYQPYPHEFKWTKDHPLEQVIREPSRPILTRNQLRSDGDIC
nr:hypothetical protein [Tanacetum cinerariifolium]